MNAIRPSFLTFLAVFAVACGSTDPSLQTGSTQGQADTVADTADVLDTGPDTVDAGPDIPQASCVGSQLVPAFAANDKDCAFLQKCPTLGECYCGDKCPTNKQKCDPSLCTTTAPKCFCGEQCSADKKKCPGYICDPLDIKDCQEQDDCVYNATKKPAWCGCQKMPDHEPDCWCGKPCSSDKPQCEPSKCTGKNPDKCIVVPGASYSACYCATCGFHGDNPKCFFVLCP